MNSEPAARPPRFLKIFLVLVLLVASGGVLAYSLWQNGLLFAPELPTPSASVPAAKAPLPSIDFDKLYSYCQEDLPYVNQIEAETVSAYNAKNSDSAPWYENGLKAVRLYAIYLASRDRYGIGIFQNADAFSQAAYQAGCRDPLVNSICDNFNYRNRHSIRNSDARSHRDRIAALQASNYPAVAKFDTGMIGLRNYLTIASTRTKPKEDMSPEIAKLPEVFAEVMAQYEALVQTAAPDWVLYAGSEAILGTLDHHPEFTPLAGNQIKEILEKHQVPGSLVARCQGDFWITWAWAARGTGWANTVTPEGWRLMRERLQKAQDILEAATAKYPDNYQIPTLMISVELGQGQGTARMEEWFKKAITLNPDYYRAYQQKMYYLQPRWYGTPQEVLNFGIECLQTDRWSEQIPMVFIGGVGLMADQNPSLYTNEKIWKAISETYSEFLKRYPESLVNRTAYLQWAIRAKQWETAREQLSLLNGDWDKLSYSESQFNALKAEIPPTT